MTDKDYHNLLEFTFVGGGFIPANEKADEVSASCTKGEVIMLKEVTARDIKLHKGYFALLQFIYDYLPASFQKKVPLKNFYKWLKHLKGQYEVKFIFKDGTTLVEYESISFGNMSQKRFEEYVKEQLPWIYENVLGAFYEGDMLKNIIDTIEEEFEKLLIKLK